MYKTKKKARDYQHSWYIKNRVKRIKQIRESERRKVGEKQRFMIDYLTFHPCVDCGESNIIVLQFDHLRDKRNMVSYLVSESYSMKRVLDEIAKCEVVCANCHLKRTAERQGNYRYRFMASSSIGKDT